MTDDETAPNDLETLTVAYEERTRQLHDARAALSEAFSALTVELSRVREQLDYAHIDVRNLREHERELLARVAALETELQASREQLAAMHNMRAVRWSERPRRALERWRERHR